MISATTSFFLSLLLILIQFDSNYCERAKLPHQRFLLWRRGGRSSSSSSDGNNPVSIPTASQQSPQHDIPLKEKIVWQRCAHCYRIGKQIGSGRYSYVFAAKRLADNASVAIKVLKPPIALWRVQREVNVLRLLNTDDQQARRLQLSDDVKERPPTASSPQHIATLVDTVMVSVRERPKQLAQKGRRRRQQQRKDREGGGSARVTGTVAYARSSSGKASRAYIAHGLVFERVGGMEQNVEGVQLTRRRGVSIKGLGFLQSKRTSSVGEISLPRRLTHGDIAKIKGGKLKGSLTDLEARWLMFQLLEALAFAHKKHVMHRDIKPSNVLLSGNRGYPHLKLTIVDWGLAEFLTAPRFSVRVASRYYKAPELLLGNSNYDERLDSWSAGCVFAGLLFKSHDDQPFFKGADLLDQLSQIAQVVGSEALLDYARSFHGTRGDLSPEMRAAIGAYNPKPWTNFLPSVSPRRPGYFNNDGENDDERREPYLLRERKKTAGPGIRTKADDSLDTVHERDKTHRNVEHLCSRDALDLLDKLLCVDHRMRLTATEALKHPYFEPIRKRKYHQTHTCDIWGRSRARWLVR